MIMFGSDSIGEQAALNAEMPSKSKLKKRRPERLDYQAVTTERSLLLVGQTVVG